MSKLLYTLLDTDPKIYHILYDLSVFTVDNLMINHKNQTNNIRRNQKIAKITNRVLVRKIFEGDFFKEYIPPHQNYDAKLIQIATVVAQLVLITDKIHAGIADFIHN